MVLPPEVECARIQSTKAVLLFWGECQSWREFHEKSDKIGKTA